MTDQKQIFVPDSPEARALAELASLHADLVEARHAFDLSMKYAEADNDQDRAVYRHLVSQGVVAYGRCFTTSNVRNSLDTYVPVPANLSAVHDQLMKLRNRTIAHSESDFQTTLVVVDLAKDGSAIEVERVFSMTVGTPPPMPFARRAVYLVAELDDALLELIATAKAALQTSLSDEQLASLWDEGSPAQFIPTLLSSWDPNNRRPPYPLSHEIPTYLFEDPSPESESPLTGPQEPEGRAVMNG